MKKKRFLALVLVITLCLSMIPWTASAAQDSYSSVKSSVEGGTNYMTSLGVTRQAIVNELEAHESDSFYLGTPYHVEDWQSPKGDTSYNGQAGMNCGGFVSYVLRKAGINSTKVMELIQEVKGQTSWFGSGKPYDIMAGASNYRNLVENGELTAYVFQTKSEMLNSGVLEKGDISQDVQTVESVSPSVLYPEPERSAYQYYPEIQSHNESGRPIGKEVKSVADKKVSPKPEEQPVLGQSEALDHAFSRENQGAVTDQERSAQQSQFSGVSQSTSRDYNSYNTFSPFKPRSEPKSTSGRKWQGNGSGSSSASHSAAPYREETKAGIKTKEVNHEIHVSGKVKLNTWQRDFMVNQINNQTPVLANATAQGGAAVQAVANYGQAAMFQAGGGMATAATGAATGGIGFAVQAGKMAADRIVEQIKSAVQSAAATFRESKQTWGTLAALFFIPLLIALGALGVFRMGGSATNVGLSAEVLALMPQINAACEKHGIPEYAPLVAAVIMQESGGNVELVNGDVMMCAEGMGYPVGTPVPVEESIDFGTGLLADLLHQAGVSGPADISKISLALQSYNFGGGYLTWAVSKYGGYSKENALEFSQQQAVAMGWSGYGDPEYVDHVLRYYQVTSGAMGDRSAIANGLFAYPMPGHTWVTYAGHEGIDISYSGIEGQPIYACAAGTVSYVQNNWSSSMGTSGMASYGNCVFINHGNGWESRYAHMSTAVVASGTFVQEGQLLGYVGSTGNSTGPHLHLALYYNSSPSSGGIIYAEQAWTWLKE